MNQIGIVGGIYGFYGGIIVWLLSYFTSIDYLTTVIKKLFLEESSDKKFYKRFFDDDGGKKKIKKNCCKELFEDFVHDNFNTL